MNVPKDYSINDPRLTKDFKGITISGYKRTDVCNAFNNSLINSQIEESCRWAVELHSTGLLDSIIKELEIVYLRNINLQNPYFLFYFYRRKNHLYKLLDSFPKKTIIFSRNNQEIRNLIAELVGICSLSKKSNLFLNKSLPKLGKYAFNKETIRKNLISDNTQKIYNYLDGHDPGEIKIALNEIANLLTYNQKNFSKMSYWYLWLKKVTQIKNKNTKIGNLNFFCRDYDIKEVGSYYRNEWVWPLWQIMLDHIEYEPNIVKTFINKLYYEYKKNYSGMNKKNKHYIILFALYILSTPVNWKVPIRQKENFLIQLTMNINNMYKNIEDIFTQKLSYNQIEKRNGYVGDLLNKSIKKDIKRKERLIKVKDTQKGTIVDVVLNKRDLEKINEEKNKKKLNAFLDFAPTKIKVKEKTVNDYFSEAEEIKVEKKCIQLDGKDSNRQKFKKNNLFRLEKINNIELNL